MKDLRTPRTNYATRYNVVDTRTRVLLYLGEKEYQIEHTLHALRTYSCSSDKHADHMDNLDQNIYDYHMK